MDDFRVKIEELLNTYTIKNGKKISKMDTEGEELKKAWFKHIIHSMEHMQNEINELKDKVEALEKHECKCAGSKIPVVRPGGPH